MTEWALLVVSLVLSGLTFVGFISAAIFVMVRLLNARAQSQDSVMLPIGSEKNSCAHEVTPLTEANPQLDNVFTRLSFADSLDPEQFVIASRESALNRLNGLFAAQAADDMTVIVDSVKLLSSRTELVFSLSRKGQKLVADGIAEFPRHRQSGRILPYIIDSKTGKALEMAKGVPTATRLLGRLANMPGLVVSAAHLIAGADIAKRLAQIDSNVNALIEYRRIDQLAELERIYTVARELCSEPVSQDTLGELRRLRGELRKGRFVWRREFLSSLNRIEDPKDGPWLGRRLSFQRNRIERDIIEKISEGQEQLGLIEYSIRLDHVLAVISDRVSVFEDTLAGEIRYLQEITALLRSKAEFISSKNQDQTLELLINSMSSVTEQFRGLLPEGSNNKESL